MEYLKLEHYKFDKIVDFTLEKLFVLIRFNIDTNFNLDHNQFQDYWIAFIKYCSFTRWNKMQIDYGRKIAIFDYGIISSMPGSKQQDKTMNFILSDKFILQHNVRYKVFSVNQGQINKTQPTIKLNFGSILKLTNAYNEHLSKQSLNIQKDKLMKAISAFFHIATNVTFYNQYLIMKAPAQIDLKQLGKFTIYNKSVSYQPFIKTKVINTSMSSSKMSVGQLLVGKPTTLAKSQSKELNQFKNMKGAFTLEDREKRDKLIKSKSNQRLNPLLNINQNFQNPTRRFHKKDIHLESEMLGAGTDPLNKDQNFSILAQSAESLMLTIFRKPRLAQIRFPAILDKFSRTLAAPISAQKWNSSISMKIASNYSVFTKSLYLDIQSKTVALHPMSGNKIIFTANPQLLIIPLDDDQQLRFIQGQKNFEFRRRMQAKKKTYQRYQLYIKKQIPQEYISRIPQTWIDKILQIIPKSFRFLSKQFILEKTEDMLLEINKDYYESIKKVILDYVLKDQEEKRRIGIMIGFNVVPQWGEADYKGITANQQWRQDMHRSKQEIQSKLLINKIGTLNMMKEWKKYQNNRFSILNKKKNMILQVRQFCRKLEQMVRQFNQIVEVQNDLKTEWVKQITLFFNKQVQDMKKKNQMIYYEATGALMSNQIRGMISSILLDYRNFFRKFKQQRYYTPLEIIEREQDTNNTIQQVFLQIKLERGNTEIIFQKDLFTSVKPDLLRIVDSVIELSKQFPRPTREKQLPGQRKNLWQIGREDQLYKQVHCEIEQILQSNFMNIQRGKDIFNQYKYLLQQKQRIEQWCKSYHDIKQYRVQLQKYEGLYKQLFSKLPFYIRMNMVLINACQIKRILLTIITDIKFILVNNIYQYIKKTNDAIQKRVEQIRNTMADKIQDTNKLVILQAFIEEVKKTDLKQILREFAQLRKWIYFCYENGDFIRKNDFKAFVETANLIFTLPDKIEQNQNRISKQRDDLQAKLNENKKIFQNDVNDILKKIEQCIKERPYKGGYQKKQAQLKQLTEKVSKLIQDMNQINKKEDHLGNTKSEFPKIVQAQKDIKPYYELWNLIAEFEGAIKQWKQQNIRNLNPSEVESFFQKTLSSANKIKQQLPQKSQIRSFCQKDVIDQIKINNKEKLELIRILANPGLKERHWKSFFNATQNQFFNQPQKLRWGNLKSIEDGGKLDELLQISQTATKQWNIQKIKNNMLNDWKQILVQLKQHKDTSTYIITGMSVDQVQALLDDQIVKTVTMKGSPYAKEFEQQIAQWQAWLRYTFNVFDYWVKVQGMWMYLQPVFTSPDISKHLPLQHQHFQEVDRNWRAIMEKVSSNPRVLQFTKNKKMLDVLVQCSKKLQVVHKGLSDYLESKRINFPRFFFLSNQELLQILSETKDPTRVQPHLKKCFEGIQKLQIDQDQKIHGMFSSQNEYVEFITIVDTKTARGNVDQWLVSVQDAMIESVRNVTECAYNQYTTIPRQKWVIKRCGMAVLNLDMTYWTFGTQNALNTQGLKGIQVYYEKCQQNLSCIVKLVRTNIAPLDRCTLEALIVLDVHNRQTVDALIKAQISDVNSFDWQSQLRYYWNENTSVRIINALMSYNYEYLGNSSRLVITPLTDRCYRTLCGALHLNYGGAPQGPAGTGKTQTVKDLAKALARQCVVYNCSDGLDYIAMGKFFKGIASSGAWSCFDEFNRINLQVLSVVAQQILTIQLARGKGLKQFIFEQTKIKLKHTANCFITMNPGYAGRSELPDNLKALFRSVAMMIPDYTLIAEISLYSFGFNQAKSLAGKVVTTYTLCSQQLSSQQHYDYGMRAVKSVLTAAGNLKRKYPDEKESILMLRAISDVNLAKFLAFDIPLFKGIISDLFPSVVLPQIDYSKMFDCIDVQMKKHNLFKVDYFIEKIIHLYQMILVRHGLMVVGMPFAGKTSTINILSKALTLLSLRKQMEEKKVEITYLNPKSITMNQLYGFFDAVSHQWYDGVLAVKFRNFAKSQQDTRKWLIFDGPIDAVWIQNMNTVLDDNKKLCLNSGQIIAMNKTMNMIFQPMDLLAASPATVSRCGMIYMQPESLGWQPHFQKWQIDLPKTLKQEQLNQIKLLVNAYIPHLIDYIRGQSLYCKQHPLLITPCQPMNILITLLRIYRILIKDFEEEANIASHDLKARLNILDYRFVFSVVWSFGGSLTTESRKPFDIFIKRLFGGDIPLQISGKKKISLPQRGMVNEYTFQIRKKPTGQRNDGQWIKWLDTTVQNEQISPKLRAHQILVKTTDTIRYTFLLEMNVKSNYPTLFCGPTGTGKSVYIKRFLQGLQKADKFNTIEIGFSAQTTSTQTQDIIDSKVDRRSKGVFGPKPGYKYVIFVDDLNMPAKQQWGAQPPIELIRQLVDHGGWYDNRDKQKTFRKLIDLVYVSAMGPPGGGRTFITPRLQRHLNLVSLTQFDNQTMTRIFGTLLKWFFSNNGFSAQVIKIQLKVVLSTLEVFTEACLRLLPTPAKSHYLFNLRDFAKVILGICMSDKDRVVGQDSLVRLWTHQTWRVFSDRLTNETDKLLILSWIKQTVKKVWVLNFDTVFDYLDSVDENGKGDGKIDTIDQIRRLTWSDCMANPGSTRYYEQIRDRAKLNQAIQQALVNFNQVSGKPMNLVLFDFAIEHLLIIARILKQPGGNALLIGVGGSGRQSMTKLAASNSDQKVMQIEITKQYGKAQWLEDIKQMLISAGKNTETIFLFTDSQIKSEFFVQDINNLLNTGQVPNLFPPDQKANVIQLVRNDAKNQGKAPQSTPSQLYVFFMERVKKNLHIVLCFSPIGDAFRTRVRMFPSLVNCCTIDWFRQWPNDALVSVAERFLKNVDLKESIRKSCVQMVQYFHESTVGWSQKFLLKLQRHYYVTPTSYIDLISTFKNLLGQKRNFVEKQIGKYQNGYEKIIVTQKAVGGMQQILQKLKPELLKAAEETEQKMDIVTKQKAIADILKENIQAEKKIVQEAVDKATEIATDCKRDLDKALPDLQKAQKAVQLIEKRDIDQMRTMKIPPVIIKTVLRALVLIFDPNPPQKTKDEKSLKYVTDWWAAAQRLLNQDILKKIKGFKIEDFDEKTVKGLQNFLSSEQHAPNLVYQKVLNASKTAAPILEWVVGLKKYYYVHKQVQPKKRAQEKAQNQANQLTSKLNVKKKQLQSAVNKVQALNSDLNAAIKRKQNLQAQYDLCQKKLNRAESLIGNLGGEKGRWEQLAKYLKVFKINLSGDILVSAGMIAYLGAFTSKFRNEIVQQWVKQCKEKNIPSSQTFSLKQVLGDAVKIREWNIQGLPSDSFSIENSIIIAKSRRYSLCIDPQGQANKWIKKMHQKIHVIKLSDSDFLRTIQNAIQFGEVILLQNVAEELDPGLNPILLKQTYGRGQTQYIKLSQELQWSNDFNFYITTKYRNPHYLPELSTKVTLLNFMITFEGLNDQLLGKLVKNERPDLQNQKQLLIVQGANNKKQMQNIENKILEVLSHSENILQDQKAIKVLTKSKETSNQISQKQKIADQTQINIDNTRQKYQPVSKQSSCLFFTISDLANIDPMYQYSLTYYIDLFNQAIIKSQKSDILEKRLQNLSKFFRLSLYNNICRSLFEKDKLLFSFLMTVRLLQFSGEIQLDILRFFFTGLTRGITLHQLPQMPDLAWMQEKNWDQICRISYLQQYKDLYKRFYEQKFKEQIETIYNSGIPQEEKLPQQISHFQNSFSKLVILRTIRLDKLVPAAQTFVKNKLGQEFIYSPAFDLAKIFPDSNSSTPLIFVLSPGSDPFAALDIFSQTKKIKVSSISLGQGQGPLAQKHIKQGIADGNWVVLQNCHLAVTWMTTLQKIVQQISNNPNIHPQFRLWLTSYPSKDFPTSILQAGVKMTNEQPKGLKSNLMSSFLTDPISNQQFFNSCAKPKQFKNLLYGLCFFHAVIQQRRNYGPLGWNIPYQFNQSDLRICVRQLKMFLDQSQVIPFQALLYLTAECNYGGRVTDDKDRRLIITLLKDYYNQEALQNGYQYAENPIYSPLQLDYHSDYLVYIKENLPMLTPPDVFGFHPNANITKDVKQTNDLLQSLLMCYAQGSSGQSGSMQQQLSSMVVTIMNGFPQQYNVQHILQKYPVKYTQSMNTVLIQQLTRFNKLIKIIRSSLKDIQLSLDGLILMSSSLQKAAKAIYDGKVPQLWMQKSYPSLKPLIGYVKDLKQRLKFFQDWIQTGKPNIFWLSGFFFTHSFLTGVLQNYARKYTIPIDEIVFDFQIMQEEDPKQITQPPEDGAFVFGMFIEGAKWNHSCKILDESDPKVLFVKAPLLLLKPCKSNEIKIDKHYNSPVYKTSSRRGTLSTTGHSTNFLMYIRLPSQKQANHWIKRGVALLTQLDN